MKSESDSNKLLGNIIRKDGLENLILTECTKRKRDNEIQRETTRNWFNEFLLIAGRAGTMVIAVAILSVSGTFGWNL